MKSVDRIKKNAEVFTPPSLAGKLISPIPREELAKNCLDPACGNGNILLQVFWRKIEDGQAPLESLKRIYGVDIMTDNVQECRVRLLKAASLYEEITQEHIRVVMTNIVCADSLAYDFSFDGSNVDQDELEVWFLAFSSFGKSARVLSKSDTKKSQVSIPGENIFGY